MRRFRITWTFRQIYQHAWRWQEKRRSQKLRKIPFWKNGTGVARVNVLSQQPIVFRHPLHRNQMPGPWLYQGISFWNDNNQKQIFFISNVMVLVRSGLSCSLIRRDLDGRPIDSPWPRYTIKPDPDYYNSLGFLFAGWAAHYLPFFWWTDKSSCTTTSLHLDSCIVLWALVESLLQ